jgi:hypothetical protein
MAASITTQADVLTYAAISDNELNRLESDRMKKDNWAALHIKAWTLIKGMLAVMPVPLEETDLDDTDEFKPVTVEAVIYIAYQEAEFLSPEDKKQKSYWFKKMRKTFAELTPTSGGATIARESYGSRRARRA